MLVSLALFFLPSLPAELESLQVRSNLRLLDRHGQLLREVESATASTQNWRNLKQISPFLVQATLSAEDARFYNHPGVDPLAIARAFRQNWGAGQVRQGGSTLTQQLVRMRRRSEDRGWRTKLAESYWALRLERRFSKQQILETYLNLAPYGAQTEGCESAAQTYFGKPADQLSLAQASFLAVLPRAPESFRPYQDPEEIVRFQKLLLARMEKQGHISADERKRAELEPLALRPLDSAWEAGHFCDYLTNRLPSGSQGEIRTTLDLELQHEVEGILKVHLRRLQRQKVSNGAVIVMDVNSGDILAMVGSSDYRSGQFNACLSGRQAGSTLKPFTYGLALERGYTAASLLPDVNLYPEQVKHGYIPQNYDRRFHGPVRLREALACSYNVPVVRLLERLGGQSLLQRLREVGFERMDQRADHYGLGLTLGAGEVSLLELARAYRCLARRGRYQLERAWLDEAEAPVSQRFRPESADLITHILKDPHARAPAFGLYGPLNFPFECAVKTGTTKGYRDNWTVGYTPLYVVACWVGNFDGTSMAEGVSGITGAAPVFHDVLAHLARRDQGSPAFSLGGSLEEHKVCATSGEQPGPDCAQTMREVFLPGSIPSKVCSMHQRIAIDRRTGRRADASTTANDRIEKVFTAYPPLYRSWALAQGIDQPPAGLTAGDSGELKIVFPDNAAVFRRQDEVRAAYQKVHFQAAVPEWCEEVEWTVGEERQMVRKRPFEFWWTMRQGGYLVRLSARGAGKREASTSIYITVI